MRRTRLRVGPAGFAGLFTSRGVRDEEIRSSLTAMAGALGVQQAIGDWSGTQGVWTDPAAGVGMVVSPGDELVGRRLAVARSGELYNLSELEGDLYREGVAVHWSDDREAIQDILEYWGLEDGIRRLEGAFALAIWDIHERTLHLVRDRLGIKPLFVGVQRGLVYFGSRLRALTVVPGFERLIDRRALRHYLRYLYVAAPDSIYRDVYKVKPGHILTISDPGAPLPTARAYWSLQEVLFRSLSNPFMGTLEEATDEMERLLTAAVRNRLGGTTSPGALLSGGIDSTSIVALLSEMESEPVKTFVVSFSGTEHDEAVYAARIAQFLGTEHTKLDATGHDARSLAYQLPEFFDEPYADAGAIPALLMAQLAGQAIDTALVGDGGDEIFGGYNRYIHGAGLIHRLSRIPLPLRRIVSAGIEALSTTSWQELHRFGAFLLPKRSRHRLAGEKIGKLGRLLRGRTETEMYKALLSAWQQPEELVFGGAEGRDILDEVLDGEHPPRLCDRMMLADQLLYLPDDQLVKGEQVSLASGLRFRSPLLDHSLVEFSWRLPPTLKMGGGRGKLSLRELLYRRIPARLIDRPKVGFSVLLVVWLLGRLRPWAVDLLGPESLAQDDLFHIESIHDAWRRLLSGHDDLALALWAVLCFQGWRQYWL